MDPSSYFISFRWTGKQVFGRVNDKPTSRTFPLGGIRKDLNNLVGTFVYFILSGSGNFFPHLMLFLPA